jgi:hypothetical protein
VEASERFYQIESTILACNHPKHLTLYIFSVSSTGASIAWCLQFFGVMLMLLSSSQDLKRGGFLTDEFDGTS